MPYRGPRSSTPAFLITLPPNETYRFDREVLQENYLLAAGTYVAHFDEKESGGEGFVDVTLATSPVPFEIIVDGGGERHRTLDSCASWYSLERVVIARGM